jgi:hypothetical protein
VSPPRKPASPVTWQTIERVADAAERERLAALGGDDIDRELREAGLDPEEAVRLVQRAIDEDRDQRRAAPGSEPAARAIERAATTTRPPPPSMDGRSRPKRDERGKRDRRLPWIWIMPAVAVAAAVLLVLQTQRPYVASSGRDANELRRQHERAIKVREGAYAACTQNAWAECERLLDVATAFDPDGEADPRVQTARKAIHAAKPERNGPDPKL